MKKVLSLVLVAAMLVCGMAIIPSATAATLDEHNVGFEAYYFGGKLSMKEASGSLGDIDWGEETVVKDGDASKGAIVLDGKIDEGEWGSPVAQIRSDYAANNDGKTYGRNTSFEEPSAENTYYYYTKRPNGNSYTPKGLNYDIYVMWDEDFLYVAAHVVDNDGHAASNHGDKAWNNDAFQFRVDPEGPNSIVNGKGYDAVGTPDEKNPNPQYISPWKGEEYNDKRGLLKETVGNFVVAYTNYTELYDSSQRYKPQQVEYEFNDGTQGYVTKYKGSYVYYMDFDPGMYGVAMTESKGTGLIKLNYTDYEVALPWGLVKDGYSANEGNELGFAAALLNMNPSGSEYNAWLGWGTGICDYQMRWDPQTCGGSNSLTLSSTPYTTARCEHDFAAATCMAPETCKLCGYQRGFKSGHSFDYSDLVLPTTTSDGSIVATCSVDGYVENITIPKADNKDIIHSFKTTDTTIMNKGFNDGFTVGWRTTNETDDSKNRIGPLAYNITDKSLKTAFDNTTFPEIGAVLDLYTNGNGKTTEPIADDVTNRDQAGTYFSLDSWNSTYTYKMDVYFPDLSVNFNDGYTSGIRNSFGYMKVYGTYSAGIYKFSTDEGDVYYAGIISTQIGDSTQTTPEIFEAKALSYTKLSASDMAENVWHTYAFMFDDASGTAVFAWDGKVVAAASDKHMCYKDTQDEVAYLRRFGTAAYLKDIVFGSPALINDYVTSGETTKYTVTVDGVETEYEVGATVSLNKEFYRDKGLSYRFDAWSGDTDVLADATVGVTEFTMPAKNVTLNSSYIIIGDANGDGSVNAIDVNLMRRMLVGLYGKNYCMDINGDDNLNAIDVNLFRRMLVGLYTPEK